MSDVKECPWCEGGGVISDGRDLAKIMESYKEMQEVIADIGAEMEAGSIIHPSDFIECLLNVANRAKRNIKL